MILAIWLLMSLMLQRQSLGRRLQLVCNSCSRRATSLASSMSRYVYQFIMLFIMVKGTTLHFKKHTVDCQTIYSNTIVKDLIYSHWFSRGKEDALTRKAMVDQQEIPIPMLSLVMAVVHVTSSPLNWISLTKMCWRYI